MTKTIARNRKVIKDIFANATNIKRVLSKTEQFPADTKELQDNFTQMALLQYHGNGEYSLMCNYCYYNFKSIAI